MSEPAQLMPPTNPEPKQSTGKSTAWIALLIALASIALSIFTWIQTNQTKPNHYNPNKQLESLKSKVDTLVTKQNNHLAKQQDLRPTTQNPQSNINTPSTKSSSPSSSQQKQDDSSSQLKSPTPDSTVSTSSKDTSTSNDNKNPTQQTMNTHGQNIQALQKNLTLQQQTLLQQTGTITKQQHQLNLQSSTLQDNRSDIQMLIKNSARSSQQWVLAEAEYLVRLATLQLNANNNVKAALQILKTIKQDLDSIQNNQLQPIRAALHHDIQILENLPPVRVNHIISQLNDLSDQIGNLPAAIQSKFSSAPKKDSQKTDTAKQEPTVTGYKAVFAGLKNLVVIKKITQDPQPVATEDEITYFKENIRLKISQAQWAVLHKNQKLYEQNLNLAQNLLEKNLSRKKTKEAVNQITKQIEALKKEAVKIQAPKLYTSIAAIHSMLTNMQPTAPSNHITQPDASPSGPSEKTNLALDSSTTPGDVPSKNKTESSNTSSNSNTNKTTSLAAPDKSTTPKNKTTPSDTPSENKTESNSTSSDSSTMVQQPGATTQKNQRNDS